MFGLKKIKCDACNTHKYRKDLHKIIDSLYICNKCVHNIFCIYVHTNTIKFLCPHCDDSKNTCGYCDTGFILQALKNKT